jgi:hypothetical protein
VVKLLARGDRGRGDGETGSAQDAVSQINAVIKGQVVDILAGHIPEFARMPRDTLFNKIMSDPQLGAGCFKLFRTKPELFASVLTGPGGEPVSEDSAMLSCGRTLANVVTMSVRNMARRYFRGKLNPAPEAPASEPSAITRFLDRLEHRIERLVGRYWRQPPPRSPAPPTPGEALYRALRDFLLHDWQVRLFPRYATLPLAVASAVGPQLLGCREPEEIDALVANYRSPAERSSAPTGAATFEPEIDTVESLKRGGMAPNALYGNRGGDGGNSWRRSQR